MSDTIIIVLEEVLRQFKKEYGQLRNEVGVARQAAYNVELKVRALAELIERESKGSAYAYSQDKILKEFGLEPEK